MKYRSILLAHCDNDHNDVKILGLLEILSVTLWHHICLFYNHIVFVINYYSLLFYFGNLTGH